MMMAFFSPHFLISFPFGFVFILVLPEIERIMIDDEREVVR